MGPDELTAFLQSERVMAELDLLGLTPAAPASIRYEFLRTLVLARHVVRATDVNRIAVRLREQKRLLFLDWEKGKRVPQPHYRTRRPSS
jgi:hypothetical protein